MSAWMTFFVNEEKQIINMRLVAITLSRLLHKQGYCHVIEQESRIVIECYSKSCTDKAQRALEENAIVWD